MTFEPIRDPLDPGPAFPNRVIVTAEIELQGRKLAAVLVVDGLAWTHSGAQEEVRRRLKRKLADEIIKHLDPQITVET